MKPSDKRTADIARTDFSLDLLVSFDCKKSSSIVVSSFGKERVWVLEATNWVRHRMCALRVLQLHLRGCLHPR